MSIKEIADLLMNAKRPHEVFGTNENEIKNIYRKYAKICHPDLAKDYEKELAQKTMTLLNEYYALAQKEIKQGIYNVIDEKELLKQMTPMFEFDIKNENYKFYKISRSTDVADIYEGLCNDALVELIIASDIEDDDLIIEEENILKTLNHLSIPKLKRKAKINGQNALIIYKPKGYSIDDIKKYYGYINTEHICWILERLLSLVGYLHSNKIVHGNIKKENILIDPETHNVVITDYSLCIKDANKTESKYKIINDIYTPSYVNKDAKVIPNVDIYPLGIIAIDLLGGDTNRIAIPLRVDVKVRAFIRKLLDKNSNDAWALWNELIDIRNELYGNKRFTKLERKLY